MTEFQKLVKAVEDIYFAGYWHCDRPVEEQALWTTLRDAAGIAPGQTSGRLGPDRTGRLEDSPQWQAGRNSAEGDLEFWSKVSYPEGMTAQDVKNELADYHFMLENVPAVYMAVTGGLLSKPMYYAETVIGVYEDDLNRYVEEAVKDAEGGEE